MFGTLQEKLSSAFKRIRGRGTLSVSDIESTLKDVRMALLEADVNFQVAKDLCANVAKRAQGADILKSLTPDQQIIKLVHEELVGAMGGGLAGGGAVPLEINVAPPAIIMLVGLQGAGKTTTASKLARLLKLENKKSVLLVPADVYRPAAIQQLKTLGAGLQIPVFDSQATDKPLDIVTRALTQARGAGTDVMIVDTAGRLQIDERLMTELTEIVAAISPQEILLVGDAMTGQEAVNVAKGFDAALSITGLILTKLDGDARGGAALSMRAVTGKPIKFVGVSEKPDGLEVFHPERMASRVLGMGDVMSLIEKATKEISPEESLAQLKKMSNNEFGLDDFLNQLKMIRKMGSISSLLGMIPGMDKMAAKVDPEKAEKDMKRVEAIILSMTFKERVTPGIIDGSRRKRIARGSGTSVEEVNKLLRQFLEMKKMMKGMGKNLGKMGMNLSPGMLNPKNLAGMFRK